MSQLRIPNLSPQSSVDVEHSKTDYYESESETENESISPHEVYVKPTKSLFKKAEALAEQVDREEKEDVIIKSFAVTVNICPNFKCNYFDRQVVNSNVKKKYKDHSYKIQQQIMQKMQEALLKRNPSITCKAYYYEICPKILQVHLHALYECPDEFKYQLSSHYTKYEPNGNATWRTIQIDELESAKDVKVWCQYIQKAQ